MNDALPPASEILVERRFDAADQTGFATFSGDWNPMHVDAVAARRTQAGAPVVHGMHTLLWCLDAIGCARPSLPSIASMKLRADQMIYLGDRVEAVLLQQTATSLRAEVLVDGAVACRLALGFGPLAAPLPAAPEGDLFAPEQAIDLDLDAMETMQGRVAFASPASAAVEEFPAACAMLGASRVLALASMTRLVGMVCPGLNSIFGGVDVKFCETDTVGELSFAVRKLDRRFRMVRMGVAGGGLQGSVDCFARMPPAAQSSMVEVSQRVDRVEFAGNVMLVIGGSRGLGEITAKIAAAGGARVMISYAAGRDDALRVAAEINGAGGQCDVLHYDATQPATAQLQNLPALPTHLCYFSTPHIGRRKRPLFDAARLDLFLRFYVIGFHDLCQALREAGAASLSVLYPSSVFVAERPPELAEYAMAKAAGEELCRDMNLALAPLHITSVRLPRLDTDQNASVTELATERGLDVMLPIIRAMRR